MPQPECDIAIIGAGAAGLSAATRLTAAGKSAICLEASNRIGGRILTIHDPLSPIPIELGAEFVHGRPPVTWDLIRAAGLTAYEVTPKAVHIDQGHMLTEQEVGAIADHTIEKMGKSKRKKDESFGDYLRHSHQSANIKDWAAIHVEGFNAARKELISAASLTKDAEAAEKIEGDRAFRILNGYDSIPNHLAKSAPIQLNSIVEQVMWRRHSVNVTYRSTLTNERTTLHCRQLISTVSIGVLQKQTIRFNPEPCQILNAASALEFGHVYRIAFRFKNAFWDEDDQLKQAGFLISKDKAFFTWWTTHPVIAPILTAWSAGTATDQFQNLSQAEIIHQALQSLSRILKRTIPRPEAAYFHDWQADPLFRGAYSYTPANALPQRSALSKPVQQTLFFAGEATEATGHASTVHGALMSGLRAANQILESDVPKPTRTPASLHSRKPSAKRVK